MADLFERDGDSATARSLRQKAQRLYIAFNSEFWLPDERYYAFCRQADGRVSRSIASNAAHTLWTGIVDPKRARAVVRRVLQSDMFSGWGVRTLSARDSSYNPVDYQLGSVWPHDNAIIVAGMQHYGFDNEANQVFTAIMQAASKFEHFRLPEVFAGHDRGFATKPVKYPVACNPQAWADRLDSLHAHIHAGAAPGRLQPPAPHPASTLARLAAVCHPSPSSGRRRGGGSQV